MLVLAEIQRVLIRETDQTFLVELAENQGARMLPIVIGFLEAQTIMRRLSGEVPPRPMTHDLFDSALYALGGEVSAVHIVSSENGVFFARILIRQGGREVDLDARPSDVLALAAGSEIPVWVEDALWVTD